LGFATALKSGRRKEDLKKIREGKELRLYGKTREEIEGFKLDNYIIFR